jgi:hypothetical protein
MMAGGPMDAAEVKTKIQHLLKHLDVLNKELLALQKYVTESNKNDQVALIDECLDRVMSQLNQAYSIMVQYDLIDVSPTSK